MDKQKIIERIEKLKAMANDKTSPHEAAIALRRIQKLMDKHNLSSEELELAKIKEETTDRISRNRRAIPEYLSNLVVVIANAFECRALIHTAYSGTRATFCGIHPGPLLCKYATEVLASQLAKARADYIKTLPCYIPSRTKTDAANSFAMGWVLTAAEKANAISPKASVEKQKLLDDYIEKEIQPIGEQRTTSSKGFADCMQDGREAAKDVQLNHGVDGQEQLKIGATA